MPEPPRRKRFQIHLSTAIVMMFAAGGLIWANVIERDVRGVRDESTGRFLSDKEFGWPVWTVCKHTRTMTVEFALKEFWTSPSGVETEVSKINIGIDVFIAFVLLLVVWFFCEHLIHRRAARKAP